MSETKPPLSSEDQTPAPAPAPASFAEEVGPSVKEMNELLAQANISEKTYSGPVLAATLSQRLIQIKQTAQKFKALPMVRLAESIASFLPEVKEIDADALTILKAYGRSFHLMITEEIPQDKVEYEILNKELREACRRYLARQASRTGKK